MPDNSKKFHEFALQSILFKGRSDWYFCYLKTEKIAQALAFLGHTAPPEAQEDINDVALRAGLLSGSVAHLAGGEVDAAVVLADVFGLLSATRMLAARRLLSDANAQVLTREYEAVAERLVRGSNPSPFVSAEDFSVPAIQEHQTPILGHPMSYGTSDVRPDAIKDNRTKGQSKGQSERMSLILDLVRKKKSLSIKEIASVIRDCSEKTIQRELSALISRGLIRKVGERRWSVYMPT